MRNVDYITNGFGGWEEFANPNFLKTLEYQYFSPTGSRYQVGEDSKNVYRDLEARFGRAAETLTRLGQNPRFIDIVRGPNGRNYLIQAINFLDAYAKALRSTGNANVAYNTASMRVGTSSPLTPSRQFLQNLKPRALILLGDFYDKIIEAI